MKKIVNERQELVNSKKEMGRQQEDKSVYIGNITQKLVDAANNIFASSEPKPTGGDMVDVLSMASVLLFSDQIMQSCNSKKTMQSVLKSTVWALKARLDTFAAPLLVDEKAWDKYFGKPEEGGDDGEEEKR